MFFIIPRISSDDIVDKTQYTGILLILQILSTSVGSSSIISRIFALNSWTMGMLKEESFYCFRLVDFISRYKRITIIANVKNHNP